MDPPSQRTETDSELIHYDDSRESESSRTLDGQTKEGVVMRNDCTDMETPRDEPPNFLPYTQNWDFHRFRKPIT